MRPALDQCAERIIFLSSGGLRARSSTGRLCALAGDPPVAERPVSVEAVSRWCRSCPKSETKASVNTVKLGLIAIDVAAERSSSA